MKKITLKKLLQKFDELGFNEIIIPAIGKVFEISKMIEDKKMLNKMETTRTPFYLCQKKKCIKIKNRKNRFILSNKTIPKNCSYCLDTENIFKMLFGEEYTDCDNLINIIRNKNKKEKFIFKLKLFIDNIKKDIDREFSYSYTLETRNNFSIIFNKSYTKSEADKIYNYFREYKKILKRKGFDLEVDLHITIMLLEDE